MQDSLVAQVAVARNKQGLCVSTHHYKKYLQAPEFVHDLVIHKADQESKSGMLSNQWLIQLNIRV